MFVMFVSGFKVKFYNWIRGNKTDTDRLDFVRLQELKLFLDDYTYYFYNIETSTLS